MDMQASEESSAEPITTTTYVERIIAIAVIAVAIIVAIAIFVLTRPQPPSNVTKIMYMDQKYMFSHNIYDSEKVVMKDAPEILLLLESTNEIMVVFNDTGPNNTMDFAYFTTVGYNTVYKMQQYSVLTKGKILRFLPTQPLSNTTLSSNQTIIFLKGPNSGANETSVSLSDNHIIVVQGASHQNMEMAGDKLVLSFLGVNFKQPNFTILVD